MAEWKFGSRRVQKRVNIIDCVIQSWPRGGLRLGTEKKQQQDLRSYKRAYKALHSQHSAHSNAVLDDLLIIVYTTSLIAPSLSALPS